MWKNHVSLFFWVSVTKWTCEFKRREIKMAKKKMEIQTEVGVVSRVGFRSFDRATVLYCTGGGLSQGVAFKLILTEGEYSIFDKDYTRTLVGKNVEYTFEGIGEMREPLNPKFVQFVEY